MTKRNTLNLRREIMIADLEEEIRGQRRYLSACLNNLPIDERRWGLKHYKTLQRFYKREVGTYFDVRANLARLI